MKCNLNFLGRKLNTVEWPRVAVDIVLFFTNDQKLEASLIEESLPEAYAQLFACIIPAQSNLEAPGSANFQKSTSPQG